VFGNVPKQGMDRRERLRANGSDDSLRIKFLPYPTPRNAPIGQESDFAGLIIYENEISAGRADRAAVTTPDLASTSVIPDDQ
jgi:hypothetical protein